jgi:ryanodine receptor 2
LVILFFLNPRIFYVQQSFEDAELKKKEVEEEEGKPDPLLQLVTTFNRGATTERAGTTFEDELYMAYAVIMSK